MATNNFDENLIADCSDKYINNYSRTNAMKLFEIVDISNEQRNVERLKQNAKHQADQVKAAQARLKIRKSQEQLNKLRQTSTAPELSTQH
jgi:hypothetical protein